MQKGYWGNRRLCCFWVGLFFAALIPMMIVAGPSSTLANGLRGTIGLGAYHSCAVMDDGSVRCWGGNSNGQLGDGTTTERHTPQRVLNLTAVTQVAGGEEHTCALKSDGTVWCWGDGSWGQLGDYSGGDPFNKTHKATPTQVWGLSSVEEIAAGGYHTCARKSDGTLWCWGWGNSGQLGNAGYGIFKTAYQVVDLPSPATTVAAGYRTTCAILSDGSVWCWGDNQCRELGRNPIDSYCWAWDCHDLLTTNRPLRVPHIPQAVSKLTMGAAHVCASDGANTWCWGSNFKGEIGDGSKDPAGTCNESRTATLITTYASDITALKAGKSTTFALRADGTVLSWGSNSTGLYGNGSQNDGNTRPGATMYNVAELAAGGWHACGRLTDGRLMCWGHNLFGQVGDATSLNYRPWPTQVVGIAPSNQTLSVVQNGSGSGTVASSPAGITCGGACTAGFPTGSGVTLTASPAAGSTFPGWSGACTGTGTCIVTMDGSKSVTATFNVTGPQISTVVDGTNYSYTIYPTTTITIFGSGFSVGGNRIQLQRPGYGDVWIYNGDGHYFWDYNGTQINASLDSRVASGTWNLTVRNSSGGVSSLYTLTIQNNAQSSAYYCFSGTYPWYYFGFQTWLCNAAFSPIACYTSNWQWTACTSSGGSSSGSVCGNGTCEAGENSSNCPQDCCDQSTPCGQTKQNQGLYYCRNMYHYEPMLGYGYWQGFKWVTANDTAQMCNESYEAMEGTTFQTQYQCGGYTGKCHSIPGGYY